MFIRRLYLYWAWHGRWNRIFHGISLSRYRASSQLFPTSDASDFSAVPLYINLFPSSKNKGETYNLPSSRNGTVPHSAGRFPRFIRRRVDVDLGGGSYRRRRPLAYPLRRNQIRRFFFLNPFAAATAVAPAPAVWGTDDSSGGGDPDDQGTVHNGLLIRFR